VKEMNKKDMPICPGCGKYCVDLKNHPHVYKCMGCGEKYLFKHSTSKGEISWKKIIAGNVWGDSLVYMKEYLTPKECEKIERARQDDVNHPPHYNNRRMEAIDIIEMIIEIEKNPKVAYNMSNVLKYLLRFRDKGTPVKDLRKGIWYLERMIQKVEEEDECLGCLPQ